MKKRLVSAVMVMESITVLLGIPVITRLVGQYQVVEIWPPLVYAYIIALAVGVWISKYPLGLNFAVVVHLGMATLMFLVPTISFLILIFLALWIAADRIGHKIEEHRKAFEAFEEGLD